MRRSGLSLSVLSLACGLVPFFAATEAGAVTTQLLAAAQAEGFANSATFNAGMGMGPQQQNQPISGSDRDANGNLLFANGILSGSGSANQQSGANQSSTGAGGANMTSVGNDLNVSFTGSKNRISSASQQSSKSQQSGKSQQSSDSTQDSNTPLNGNLNF